MMAVQKKWIKRVKYVFELANKFNSYLFNFRSMLYIISRIHAVLNKVYCTIKSMSKLNINATKDFHNRLYGLKIAGKYVVVLERVWIYGILYLVSFHTFANFCNQTLPNFFLDEKFAILSFLYLF